MKTDHSKTPDSSPEPSSSKNDFICGVLEGFYGKPWTMEQRTFLFTKLRNLKLNTYVYAPKDDLKHRSQWRLLYDPEEQKVLRYLITEAKQANVSFVYAISPGLDIIYSDENERNQLKNKLDQVKSLGCEAFALLFDDIETSMNEADEPHFSSFVCAQVAVTNDVYEHLGCPTEFYFCPTEYCETRAVPTLLESNYLLTLGRQLHYAIKVFWTVDHIKEVAKVLGRKPLIWDNLHANDYDTKRVYLGPFIGRSQELKDHISGLLLNPNCKFETNFVPLNTLADWNTSKCDASSENGSNDSDCDVYQPQLSLKNAISLWITHFNYRHAPPIPPVERIDVAAECPEIVSEIVSCRASPAPIEHGHSHSTDINLDEIVQSAVVDAMIENGPQTVNSLTMDYCEIIESTSENQVPDEVMDVSDSTSPSAQPTAEMLGIDHDVVATIVDIYYLPFESGQLAREIFECFCWLYENSQVMRASGKSEAVSKEWETTFNKFISITDRVNVALRSLPECPNKSLVSELTSYVWEAHGSLSVVVAVAKWLRCGKLVSRPDQKCRFWDNDYDGEPWATSGGIALDCARLVAPTGPIVQLFLNKAVLPLSLVNYSIRSCESDDMHEVADQMTHDETKSVAHNCLRRDLYFERYFSMFDTPTSVRFVADEHLQDPKVISCACANPDAKAMFSNMHRHMDYLYYKYENMIVNNVPVIDIIEDRHSWYPDVPDQIYEDYPAYLEARFMIDAYDAMPTKRLIQCVASSLFMNGSRGMFVAVPTEEENRISFFVRLGFGELEKTADGRFTFLGHSLCADAGSRDDAVSVQD